MSDFSPTCPTLVSQAPSRGFEEDEYLRRCTAIQNRMRDARIDVLWLSTEADIRYVTGFLTQFWQSPTRPWYLVLPQEGKPIAVIPAIGAHCMQRTWVSDIRVWSSPHPTDDGISLLVDTITEVAGNTPVIGVPTDSETYIRSPVQDIDAIRQRLCNAHWCDATQVLRATRQIKSASEIEKLRYICSVTSAAFAAVPAIIHCGMSEVEVFRAFRIACLQAGADESAYLVGAATLNGYEDIISPPGAHVLSPGDILILDTGCTYDGYYSDFDRNFALGSVDRLTAAAHQRVWDATEAALAILRPGVSCASLFATMQAEMQPGNGQQSDVGRLGHGLGIQLTETPSIAAFDHTPLEAGMVMTLEPGYSYAPGKLMVHEENVVITENGYELLSSRAPRDIPIIN